MLYLCIRIYVSRILRTALYVFIIITLKHSVYFIFERIYLIKNIVPRRSSLHTIYTINDIYMIYMVRFIGIYINIYLHIYNVAYLSHLLKNLYIFA